MFQAKLYKVLPGKLEEWRAWCRTIQSQHKSEAFDTLREESNVFEGFLCFERGGEAYTLGMGIGAFLPGDETNPLNREFLEKKNRCLGEEVSVEILYSLIERRS